MTAERWAQIEELFHRAAECDPKLRASLLDGACKGDDELRWVVEGLLASEETARDDMQAAVHSGLDGVMFPMIGETVSHYRILEGLGGGGMGSVYRAEDIKLGRQVALKFLPEESTKDPAALGRFEREARSASALEHPNICPIYEFGEYDGQPFLAMRLLEGQTLRDLISLAHPGGPPLPLNKLLDLAIHITSGLEAAHSQGIIHRDIKPANIFVTTQGQAMILDFGLAKLFRGAAIDDERERTPHKFATGKRQASWRVIARTYDSLFSFTGAAIGTAGYMSPEQARGERLDARTDLFSLGAVLYEMATGKKAFCGTTAAIIQEAILNGAPTPLARANPDVPPELERIVNKALEKDRKQRYQSAVEIRTDLERLKQNTESTQRALPSTGVEGTASALEADVGRSPAHQHGGTADAKVAHVPRKIMAGVLGAVVIVLAGLGFWRIAGPGRSAVNIQSLAVLPLENLSGDATQEYFADGLTDELITDLGQIGSLRVISRTSVRRYKGARKPLPEIARELDVDAVVEGTVLRSGDQVRITAQLIQARVDKQLWADTYQGDVRDVLGLQNQVAGAIARQIRVKLSPEQQATLQNARAINPEAYEAYLRGVSQSRTVDGFHKKIAYFERALARQPDYAEAHVGLADAYMFLGHMVALPPQEAFPKAKSEALKALQLDDSHAEAHELLGTVKFLYDWDFPGAEKEFQRALVLNPNSVAAHSYYSDFLSAMGRPDEAIAEEMRIRQIDPLTVSAGVANQQYWAGRYDPAIENARSVLAIDPNHYAGHLCLGLALAQKRQFPEAIVELQKAVDLSNEQMWMAFVAHAKALAGDKAGARKILADLEVLSRRRYVSPYLFALVYPDLGDKEQAFFWLEKCYQGREHDLVFSRVWPMFDSLRSDPRYQDLMRRVGLPLDPPGVPHETARTNASR